NDSITGSPGADTIMPGPGVKALHANGGNDTVVVFDTCEIKPGTVLDGGSGTDTLVTPVSVTAVRNLGATVTSFENVVIDTSQRYLSECCGGDKGRRSRAGTRRAPHEAETVPGRRAGDLRVRDV